MGYELVDDDVDANTPDEMGLREDNPNLYKKEDDDRNDAPRWELNGTDGSLFQFSTPADGIGRRIHFRDAPDYENPQDANRDNVYELVVVVIDNSGVRGERAVRVEVMNIEETGEVELSPVQPNIEEPATADLSDYDGIMTAMGGEETIVSWQWYWTADDIDIDINVNDGKLQEVDRRRWQFTGTIALGPVTTPLLMRSLERPRTPTMPVRKVTLAGSCTSG